MIALALLALLQLPAAAAPSTLRAVEDLAAGRTNLDTGYDGGRHQRAAAVHMRAPVYSQHVELPGDTPAGRNRAATERNVPSPDKDKGMLGGIGDKIGGFFGGANMMYIGIGAGLFALGAWAGGLGLAHILVTAAVGGVLGWLLGKVIK